MATPPLLDYKWIFTIIIFNMKMIYLLVISDNRNPSSFLLIAVLNLLCYIGGKCLVVETSLGGDAVLPCGVEPNIDTTDLAVEWSRPDLPPDQYVHFQRYGQEFNDAKNPFYGRRTSLFMGELKKGNVSLKLSRVKQADEGIYTCYIPEINKKCTVQLIVVSSKEVPEVSEDKPGDRDSYDSYMHIGSTEEVSTAGQFPWWGGFIIITLIVIMVFVSGLVYKRRSIREFVHRVPKPANPAGDEDRSKDGVSEVSPMNGVSTNQV